MHIRSGYTVAQAMANEDGLAVVGIFFHIGSENSVEFQVTKEENNSC